MQWKLTHKDKHERIENVGGKTLSYDPNLGIQIIEEDGYAFKDLNNNGKLDPFEDWRLPLNIRVKDFTTRFHLWQEDGCLFYNKGKVELPKEFCEAMYSYKKHDMTMSYLRQSEEDREYLEENYMIALLLLMLDNDYDDGRQDYLLSMMIQSMELGLLQQVMYSVIEAMKRYITVRDQLYLQDAFC